MAITKPIISIIIPVYNAEVYLKRCIDSVITQTFMEFELLLIDDGSSDNSLEICKLYETINPRIRVFHKENGGVSSARNEGLKQVKGRYIVFLDSDDSMQPDLCATLVRIIEDKQADLVVCGTNESDGGIWAPSENKDYTLTELQHSFSHILKTELLSPVWNKIYKRELIEQLFDERTSFGEDLIFNLNYLQKCQKISFIKDCLLYHDVENPSSLAHRVYPKRLAEIELCQTFVTDFCKGILKKEVISQKYLKDIATYSRMIINDHTIKKKEVISIFTNWHKHAILRRLRVFGTNLGFKNELLLFWLKYGLWKMAFIQIRKKVN